AQFVADGKNQPSPWQSLKNQIYLGSEAFVEQMQDKVEAGRHLSEIPMTQRRPMARPLGWYFQEYRDRNSAIIAAFRSGGYSVRKIGDHVRLHYSRISRIIKLEQKTRSKT
ncbi:MAG: addiction module toxin RelE, partial [Gammaproteobacteria bacterium]|nr:addiction module toxin RelE [Gammaproteobacteria bacterium]MBU1653338.1 addiction module toxin RelE [Gammaproteobacteria bacterium]MBU1962766.1 addiction module toxin RelE [Gammaproteobacteria bacterium]